MANNFCVSVVSVKIKGTKRFSVFFFFWLQKHLIYRPQGQGEVRHRSRRTGHYRGNAVKLGSYAPVVIRNTFIVFEIVSIRNLSFLLTTVLSH